jgi:large subunit ribosomal protein L21
MKYAVFEQGEKQYRASEGDEVVVEKLAGNEGDSLVFDKLMLYVDGENRQIGHPYLDTFSIRAKIISQFKGKKIRVATYKAKSRLRRVKGHRQQLTKVLVEKIELPKSAKPVLKKPAKTKPAKQ